MTAIDAEALARLRAALKKVCGSFAERLSPEQRHARCAVFVLEQGEAIYALLDIAEAVARAPVARIETDGFADDGMPIVCLAADSIKAERAIKKMHMLRVRIVPCTGGGE